MAIINPAPVSGGLLRAAQRATGRRGVTARDLLARGNSNLPTVVSRAVTPWDPGFRIINNPGGNFVFGQAVPNARSLVGPLNQTLVAPGSVAQQLAIGPGSGAGGLAVTGPGSGQVINATSSLGPAPSMAGAAARPMPAAAAGAPGASAASAASAAAPAANAAAAAGPTQSRLAQMLSRTRGSVGGGGAGAGRFAAGSMFGPGSIGRGGLYALGGTLASGAFDQIVGEQDGSVDDAISNALQWGGIGAGIGSFIAPGVGTAIGGGLGAVGGAAYTLLGDATGLWGGGAQSAPTAARNMTVEQDGKLNAMMAKMGLSGEAQLAIRNQLMGMNYESTDKNAIKANYTAIMANIPAIAQQEADQKRQLTNILAMQQSFAPQFDSFLQGLGADQRAFQTANNEFADSLGGANGAYIRKQGARGVLSDAATSAAYKAQLDGQVASLGAQVGAPQSIMDQLLAQYG
jgi:hypothetical protein